MNTPSQMKQPVDQIIFSQLIATITFLTNFQVLQFKYFRIKILTLPPTQSGNKLSFLRSKLFFTFPAKNYLLLNWFKLPIGLIGKWSLQCWELKRTRKGVCLAS